ncbi:MAG: transketolase family protein [Lachnospiraceae bacterium]|jgi:transketolase|nr:transketolase family protein [Lachnospiraceae bacterium]HBE08492.1 transketolase [Lachnospiraceae bacterium]
MFELEDRWLRETYVDCLIEAAKQDDRIVILEADLSNAGGTKRFTKEFDGKRTVDVGIQEANMIGVAAGMNAMGKIPFTHTFTPFATRRVADQVTLSVSYAGLNVKMMGSDPGVTAEMNGGTHMSMEDVSIMRNIPDMVIYEPVDSAQLKAIFPQILEHDGPVYIRLLRRNAVKIWEDGEEFTLGKGKKLRDGKDISIFCSGIEVAESMKAAEELAKEGIQADVINIHTIKPIDTEAVLESAKKTGAVVVAENHSIIGGLGSAVAETLIENHPVPMKRVGVTDHFGEVGKTDYLMDKYGLLARDIIAAAKSAIAMK